MSGSQPRESAGRPTGGRFANAPHDESDVEISSDPMEGRAGSFAALTKEMLDEGWTPTRFASVDEALADPFTAQTGARAGLWDNNRRGQTSDWRENAGAVEIWRPDPANVPSYERGSVIALVASADGSKAVRRYYTSSGSSGWINPPFSDLAGKVRSLGRTGRTLSDARESERLQRQSAAEEERARNARLFADAQRWMKELGWEATDIDQTGATGGRIEMDAERFLTLLRQAAASD